VTKRSALGHCEVPTGLRSDTKMLSPELQPQSMPRGWDGVNLRPLDEVVHGIQEVFLLFPTWCNSRPLCPP
jgi:hypothetical protein